MRIIGPASTSSDGTVLLSHAPADPNNPVAIEQADPAVMRGANNLSDVASASTARTNIGLGTIAVMAASSFLQVANNLSDLNNAATARTNLGLGSASVQAASAFLQTANNLSDLGNVVTARSNLGLGSAALQATSAFLQPANNLSDVTNAATALSNLGGVASTLLGANNGVAQLDSSGKLKSSQIPASLVGAVQYQGTWNANTNSPTLVSSTGTKGQYYKVSAAGTTAIDGVSQWNIGDTIIFDGSTWDKIDGISSEVVSVAGKTGVVALANTDISGLGTASTFAASAFCQAANNLSDVASASTARTNLGLGTAAVQNVGAFCQTANNLSDLASASTARTNLGLGSAAVLASSAVCQTANNLSDVASAATALSNLGGAPLASPGFTGVPTAPTATVGTNTTQLATCAFVLANGGGSPAGSSGQLQFNNSGSFGGTGAIAYSTATQNLKITASGSTIIPLVLQGAAGQSANLLTTQTSTPTVGASINSAAQFTNSGGNTGSEAFGATSTFSAQYGVLIGASASLRSNYGVCIGNSAAIDANSSNCVTIGQGASTNNGVGNIIIGTGAQPAGSAVGCIILGYNAASTGSNQFIAGSAAEAITSAYFGQGPTAATPSANVTVTTTGGNGLNVAGSNLVLAPGVSTGNAAPAVLNLQGTTVGSTGSTAQTLATALQVTNASTLTLSDAVNVACGTTTGTKIGTSTTQKIGFYNKTPIVQAQLSTGVSHTVDDVITALQNLGLVHQ